MKGVVLNEMRVLNNLWVFVGKINRLKVRFQLFIKNPSTKFIRNRLSDFRDTTYAHGTPLWLHLAYFTPSTRDIFVQGPLPKRRKEQDYFVISYSSSSVSFCSFITVPICCITSYLFYSIIIILLSFFTFFHASFVTFLLSFSLSPLYYGSIS